MTEAATEAAPAASLPPKNRTLVIGSTVVGTVLLLVAAWLLLVTMRGSLDEERAFRAAQDCAPGTTATDCLRSVPAVIERTQKGRGKTPNYWMYVKDADGETPVLHIRRSAPDSSDTYAGKRIHVTYWEGSVRYLDWANARWYTYADPRGSYRLFLAWGLALGTFGAGALLTALWWVRGYATTRLRYPWQPAVVATGTLALVGAGALIPWFTNGWRTGLLVHGVAGAVVVAGCALAAVLLRRANARKTTDTVTVQTVVPTEEAVFPGFVRGDVPYGGSLGGGFLVAEAGRLSIIPDPNYRVRPRIVPGTLEPLRVRPPYRTDPKDLHLNGNWLVVECRDGDTPVYVATAKECIPLLLGSLTTARQLAQI
ncbi:MULTISPECIES: hypothetical protein [unclassified Streptomyces]|uniref:hypothetical protein n=1 Tax=unclassified Streptomyces TaxID=2593676 RepID=UPI00381CF331